MIKNFKLIFTVQGPVMFGSTASKGFGMDSPVLRNHNKEVIIAGTHIIGKLRHAWKELSNLTQSEQEIDYWLGKEGGNHQKEGEWSKPTRSRIFISDLVMNEVPSQDKRYTRIAIDDDTGTVKDGALQVIETPVAPKETARFNGIISVISEKEESNIDNLAKTLEKILQYLPNIGGFRTIGYGKIQDVTISEPDKSTTSTLKETRSIPSDKIICSLEFLDPFCIAKPKRGADGNLFESEKVISGGVIKGAIANMIRLQTRTEKSYVADIKGLENSKYPTLCKHFSEIRILHAKPFVPKQGKEPQRPKVIPKSLAIVKDKVYDMANVTLKNLHEDKKLTHLYKDSPPAFALDWKSKDSDIINKLYPSANIHTDIRVRTKIAELKNRHETEKLFAYETIVPQDDLHWVFEIDLNDVSKEDKQKICAELKTLLKDGIYTVGKTDARANVTFWEKIEKQTLPTETEDKEKKIETDITDPKICEQYALILETPCVMVRNKKNFDMKTEYEYFFGEHITLTNHFTQETLVGGLYLHKRSGNTEYNPHILTEAGSVFVVKATHEEGIEKLKTWLTHGMDGLTTDWQKSPYIRQNGFGEIRLIEVRDANKPIYAKQEDKQ